MTTLKEELLNEIENTPITLLSEVLDFVRFIKTKKPQVDFMEFAGMASAIDDVMREIVEQAESNRRGTGNGERRTGNRF